MASGQKDGLGFTITNEKSGDIYHRGFNSPRSLKAIGKKTFKKKVKHKKTVMSNSVDLKEEGNSMLLMHSRTATNGISIQATHPFDLSDSVRRYFIHNGVVDIPATHEYPCATDNDSEWLGHEIKNKGIKGYESFSGYAATVTLEGPLMHVFKDDYASLHISWSDKLDTYIITTTLEDCEQIGNVLSDDFTTPEMLKDNYLFSLSQKGEITNEHDIDRSSAWYSSSATTLADTAFAYQDTDKYFSRKRDGLSHLSDEELERYMVNEEEDNYRSTCNGGYKPDPRDKYKYAFELDFSILELEDLCFEKHGVDYHGLTYEEKQEFCENITAQDMCEVATKRGVKL